jgi:hypothetical protein
MPPRKISRAVPADIKPASVSNTASQPEEVTKVFPPYLRYFVPDELAQIKANLQQSLNELDFERLLELAGHATSATIAANPIDLNSTPVRTDIKIAEAGRIDPKMTPGVAAPPAIRGRGRDLLNAEQFATPSPGRTEVAQSPTPIAAAPIPLVDSIINELLSILKQPLSTAKTATQVLTLNPAGTVQMGFWCKTTFRARTGLQGDYYKWSLKMSDGTAHDLIGGKKNYTKTRHLDFVLDGDTYGLSAYGGNGIAKFIVVCTAYIRGDSTAKATESSDGVLLHFVNQPCLEIHSVSTNAPSVKGGDKNDWFTFTINITGKAPPGGQVFHLSTNSKKHTIHGGGTFYIAEGQTSETVSYFLGADNVAKDHDILIIAKMNGKQGLVNLKIRK